MDSGSRPAAQGTVSQSFLTVSGVRGVSKLSVIDTIAPSRGSRHLVQFHGEVAAPAPPVWDGRYN